MSHKLWDYLNDINEHKQDIFSDDVEHAERTYNPYVIAMMLARNADCIFHVNEINRRSPSKRQHFDFLFHSIPKRKRWGKKMSKEKIPKEVEFIMMDLNVSQTKALEYLPLLSDQELKELVEKYYEGGIS